MANSIHPAISAVQQELSELVGAAWLHGRGCGDIQVEQTIDLPNGGSVRVDAVGTSPDGKRIIVEVTLGPDLEAARGEKFLADVAKLKLLKDLGIADQGVILLGSQRALQQATGRRWAALAARTWDLTVDQATLDQEQQARLAVAHRTQGSPEANTRRDRLQ